MQESYIDALKALGEPNRLKLFWLLVHVDQRICVAEAMDVTGDSQYNVSRNLKTLHKAKLITPHKEGKWVFYELAKSYPPSLLALIESVKALPSEGFVDAIQKCQLRLSLRENNACVLGANSDTWREKVETLTEAV
ncbi:ArsR/SmtB family transcription factor [Thaumasiovibrio subtropicus]|uniref:ArsR/SmtB family transcription factor n=1 Tax=Thaumasiovibrio subtropicus TaxID=1891207 RepID=UPI000B358A6B|nr:metalloregulator ArsR/SmtB family transcription factor [Thaumasiovibrio subtropicus]